MKYSKFMRLTALILALMIAMPLVAQHLAVLSDIHVTPGNENERQLRLAIEEINASDVVAVVVSGDLTNEGSDEQLLNVKRLLDGITKPCYVIPGNHENNWSQSACQTFGRLWGSDRFSVVVDNLIIIGTNCGPFMKMGDGHVNSHDLTWLQSELKRLYRPGMRVLSVNHYPLLDDMDNYVEYQNVLKDYPVIAHQHGHFHKWMQYKSACGIESIGVRALDMKDGKGYGYTLLDIAGDSVKVWNKVVGESAELKYAFAVPMAKFKDVKRESRVDYTGGRTFEITKIADEAEWSKPFGASIFTRPAITGSEVFYGTSLGELASSAGKRSRLDCGMLFSRPAVWQNTIVVPTGDNRLLWIDLPTGAVKAQYRSGGPYVADGLVVDGILYQGGYKSFEAWDMTSGKMLWKNLNIDNYCQGEPFVGGDDVIFGAWDGQLRCLDRKSGKLKWQWDNGKPRQHLLSPGNVVPAVNTGHVIIVAPDRYMTCLDRATGRQLWRHFDPDRKVRESLGMSADGKRVYAKTMDGTVVAVDAISNEYRELWNTDCGFGYEHAPCPIIEVDGLVYTGSRRGQVAVIDSMSGELLSRTTLGYSEVNGFAVDKDNNVICTLIEGTAFKIKPTNK